MYFSWFAGTLLSDDTCITSLLTAAVSPSPFWQFTWCSSIIRAKRSLERKLFKHHAMNMYWNETQRRFKYSINIHYVLYIVFRFIKCCIHRFLYYSNINLMLYGSLPTKKKITRVCLPYIKAVSRFLPKQLNLKTFRMIWSSVFTPASIFISFYYRIIEQYYFLCEGPLLWLLFRQRWLQLKLSWNRHVRICKCYSSSFYHFCSFIWDLSFTDALSSLQYLATLYMAPSKCTKIWATFQVWWS